MEDRFLIAYASIGSGHATAAAALATALRRQNPSARVDLVDVLSRSPRGSIGGLLSALSTVAFPRLYSWAWESGSLGLFFQFSRRLPWIRQRLIQTVEALQPQAVACTHALPCAILAALPQERHVPLMGVATDYQMHAYWPLRGVDAYVVAGDAAAQRLRNRGVAADRIHACGIPIHRQAQEISPGFSAPVEVLVLAGARQVGPYLPLYRTLLALFDRITAGPPGSLRWTFVFGNARWLRRQAERRLGARPDVTLLGYVQDMPARLAQSSLVIAKPGGLTLAEAFAAGRPMLLPVTGAGQEAANSAVATAAGAAEALQSADALYRRVHQLAADPEALARLQAQARALGRPDAADCAARLLIGLR